jgi:hypothetical protein
MCYDRILCRLRFVANSWKISKQPIRGVLQEAVNSLAQLKGKKFRKLAPAARSFVERAKDMIKLIDTWVKHQTLNRLGELVEGVYCLQQVGELKPSLDTIPNGAIDPSSRKSLLNIVCKVARYREATRFLYRTAKKFPLAQKMKVVLVNLPYCSIATVRQLDGLHSQASTP